MRTHKRLSREEGGNVMIEFAMLAPVDSDGVVHAVAAGVGAVPRPDQQVDHAIVEQLEGRAAEYADHRSE